MSPEMEKCYEILGARPGASAQELKAAYKDMAKVWHPDRFAHDPPLQQKAQEKLKEINDAYAQLTSRHTSRRARPSATATQEEETREHATRPHARHKLSYAALLVFAISFVVALSVYLVNSRRVATAQDAASSQTASTTSPAPTDSKGKQADERTRTTADNNQKLAGNQKALKPTEAKEQAETSPAPVLRPLPTVTVSIDPSTGQLATAACPLKQSMTYPEGRQPRQYCTAAHGTTSAATGQQKQNKSRLRSVAERVASPKTWFGKKEKNTEQ